MEIQDLLQWLENTDLRLISSKTMWGMPDSASERLSAHLVKSDAAFVLALIRRLVHSTGRVNPFCFFTCNRSCAMRWTQSSTRTRMWKMLSTGCLRAVTWSAVQALSTSCLFSSKNGHPCAAKSRSGRSLFFFLLFVLKPVSLQFYPNATYTRVKVRFAGFGDGKNVTCKDQWTWSMNFQKGSCLE